MYSAFVGALAGAVYGFVGYFKNKKKAEIESELVKFEWKTLLTTVAGAAIIGGYATYAGLPFDVASNGAIGLLVTQFIKQAKNAIF